MQESVENLKPLPVGSRWSRQMHFMLRGETKSDRIANAKELVTKLKSELSAGGFLDTSILGIITCSLLITDS